jgi:hypothetical protein
MLTVESHRVVGRARLGVAGGLETFQLQDEDESQKRVIISGNGRAYHTLVYIDAIWLLITRQFLNATFLELIHPSASIS